MIKVIFILFLVLIISLPSAFGIPLSDKTALKSTFPVVIGEHNFVVEVAGNLSADRFDFSASDKKITLELTSSLENNILEISFSKRLLGGDLSFIIDGNEILPDTKFGSEITFVTMEFTGLGKHNLEISGTTHLDFFDLKNELDFEITDGYVDEIIADMEQNSLIITLFDPGDDGSLSITLPEDIITPFDDGTFVVLVNEEQVQHISEGNTITILFNSQTEEIEIIGTHVVPEFSQIAPIVLATSLIGLLFLKRSNRFNRLSLVK